MEINTMAEFNQAFKVILKHEGGFQKLPNDKGNWTGGRIGVGELKGTKYGISAAQFPELDIQNLTVEQASEIYKSEYWFYDGIESQPIADKLADLGVLFGVSVAVSVMQLTLQSIDPTQPITGKFGPITLGHINQAGETSLLTSYKANMLTHAFNVVAKNPAERAFIGNWGNRINCEDDNLCSSCRA
jgi:lysozyme family protein